MVHAGVHPYRFRKYIRHIQVNNQEQVATIYRDQKPEWIEKSWGNPEVESVISFPVEIGDEALIQDDLPAIKFLDLVKLTQNNWIKYGTNLEHPYYKENPDSEMTMNVSNTITVKDDEWDDVKAYLWKNRKSLCGISLLADSGYLEYRQAPYTKYEDPVEIASKYGSGSLLGGGLIVDGLRVYDNLWDACDSALGDAPESLNFNKSKVLNFIDDNIDENGKFLVNIDGVMISDINVVYDYIKSKYDKRKDWVRRFNKFSCNYSDCNHLQTAYCLKQINIFHKYHNLVNHDKDIDWSGVKWRKVIKEAGSDSAGGCSGGKCEIVTI